MTLSELRAAITAIRDMDTSLARSEPRTLPVPLSDAPVATPKPAAPDNATTDDTSTS